MPIAEVLARVRTIAAELSKKLEAVERDLSQSSDPDGLYIRVAAALDSCLASLVELNIWGEENRLPSSEIWNVAGNWLERGWLQNHARSKPRGYAGDHEMLARIYQHSLSDDPFGRLFDRYFQSQAAPQAVRNRMRMTTDWIGKAIDEREPTKIAVVGSALGLEVRDALLRATVEARHSLAVTLLDLDPVALDFAREQLQSLLPPQQLKLVPANLLRLPDRANLVAPLGGSDLIFCPGLFDYLEDSAAIAMIRCLFGQVALRGQLVIFQFAPHNPTRAYMEWLGNWYLTYREPQAFRQLFEAAKLPNADVELAAEPLGVDLYAKLIRNA